MFIPEFPSLESYELYINIKTLKYNKLVMGKFFLNEVHHLNFLNYVLTTGN